MQEEFSRLRQQREEEQRAKQPLLTLEQQQQLAFLKEQQQHQPQIHPDAKLDWGWKYHTSKLQETIQKPRLAATGGVSRKWLDDAEERADMQ